VSNRGAPDLKATRGFAAHGQPSPPGRRANWGTRMATSPYDASGGERLAALKQANEPKPKTRPAHPYDLSRRKPGACTCTHVWLCQSMRPVKGNRRELRVHMAGCPVHGGTQ
jgi:hypothetical protein